MELKRSTRDLRDYSIKSTMSSFPREFINTYGLEPFNQGRTASCTAHAICALKEIQEYKERNIWERFSPGFIFGIRKFSDKTADGIDIRTALKEVKVYGVCEYRYFPYVEDYETLKDKFKENESLIMVKAQPQVALEYGRLNNINEIKTAIIRHGGVITGVNLDNEIYRCKKEVIDTPEKYTPINYYHAMLIIGYTVRNNKEYFVVLNSYGSGWGKNGICLIQTTHPAFKEFWYMEDKNTSLSQNNYDLIEVFIDNPKILKSINFNQKYETVECRVAPFIQNGITFIELSAILNALGGYDYKWIPSKRCIEIRTKKDGEVGLL